MQDIVLQAREEINILLSTLTSETHMFFNGQNILIFGFAELQR